MRLQQARDGCPAAASWATAACRPCACTPTRARLQAGDLFVALKGERFDANDFLAQARAQGAVAAIAHHGLAAAGLPGIEVPDTQGRAGRLAAGLAQAVPPAAGGGHGQQRQDHRHADDRVHPARLAADKAFATQATSTTTSACRSRCCACGRTMKWAWSSSA
jgi:hypothetical protein